MSSNINDESEEISIDSIIKSATNFIVAAMILGAISEAIKTAVSRLYVEPALEVVDIVAKSILYGKDKVKTDELSEAFKEEIRELTGLSVDEIVEIACSDDKESEIVVRRI